MNQNFICPFCNSTFPLFDATYQKELISFNSINNGNTFGKDDLSDNLQFEMFKCPSCEEVTVKTLGVGNNYPGVTTHIHPKYLAKQFPDYIPQQIRNDYEEACAIFNLSPKAYATLSRRTLQGMIRDFWGESKKSLAGN